MRVAMIGPDLDAKGGISSLARSFVESRAMQGIDLRYIGTVGSGSRPVRALQMLRGEANFLADLAQRRPEVVHIHVADGLSFYRKAFYAAQARAAGARVVLHNNYAHLSQLYGRSPAHAAMVRGVYERADRVCAVSHKMAADLSAWTEGRAKVQVLFNPVVARDFPCALPRPARPRPTVLFMGYVGDRKGIFDLVAVWPEVLRALPRALLRVGGNGEVDRLKAEVERLNLSDSVEVMGWVSGEARMAAYASADVYCLPSYAEGQPISVLEAMASGLPVVSTDVDGIPDSIIEGQTGYMVKPGDRPALGEALVRLLRDPWLRDAFGGAGRARVLDTFDAEVVSAQLRRIWEELL